MAAQIKNNITVLIEVRNAENEIADCISSAKKLASEIILVDIESTDKTPDIARVQGAKVYSFPFTPYVEPARQFGIEKVKTKWFFILDADERITKELADEILAKIKSSEFTYYKVPRKNIFGNPPAGRWLKHGGWWPDHQMRLINKSAFKKWPKEIHSTPIIEGPIDYLTNPLEHLFHGDLETMVQKTAVFEDIESDLLYKAGRSATTFTFFRKFFGELFRRLIKKVGFMDGNIGIIEAVYQAFSKTTTYLYLYEKKNSRSL